MVEGDQRPQHLATVVLRVMADAGLLTNQRKQQRNSVTAAAPAVAAAGDGTDTGKASAGTKPSQEERSTAPAPLAAAQPPQTRRSWIEPGIVMRDNPAAVTTSGREQEAPSSTPRANGPAPPAVGPSGLPALQFAGNTASYDEDSAYDARATGGRTSSVGTPTAGGDAGDAAGARGAVDRLPSIPSHPEAVLTDLLPAGAGKTAALNATTPSFTRPPGAVVEEFEGEEEET